MKKDAKWVLFGADCDGGPGGGLAWPCAFVALACGFFAALLAKAMGLGWWGVFLCYVVAGNVSFMLAIAASLLIVDAPPSANADVESATYSWVQRSPLEFAIDDGRIFCVASTVSGRLGLSIAEAVAESGYCVDVCDSLTEALDSITSVPDRWSLLMVDFDECERRLDLDEIADELVRFRADAPHIPIITLSSGFARDDFGLERLAISDFSIRLPATTARIFAAVETAFSNNSVWRARVRYGRANATSTVSLHGDNAVK